MSDMPQNPPPAPQFPTEGVTPPPPGSPAPGYTPQPGPPVQGNYTGPQQQFAGAPSKDEKTMAMLIHVLVIFTGFVGPLIVWAIKKDDSAFIDRHGKTALNFSITLMIAYFISAILILVLIGILMILALLVIGIVFPIIAALAANKGEEYTYPASFKFLK